MARKADPATDRIYQDFEPVTKWTSEPGFDTLNVTLPGFRKEQLKVQVTPTRKLRLMGERPAGGNKWIRFRKEFHIRGNIDIDAISANFENETLSVKHPKFEPQVPPKPKLKPEPEPTSKVPEPQTKPPTPPQPQPQPQPLMKTDHQPLTQKTNGQKPKIQHPETAPLKPISGTQTKKGEKGTDKESVTKTSDQSEETSKLKEKYTEKIGGLMKEVKNRKQLLMNLVAALLVVLLLIQYARNAVRSSIGKSVE